MLKAKKSFWFEKLFAVYNRNLLKRRFYSFQIQNLENLLRRDKSIPLIIYANHSSWWDGLILFEILKNLDFENYVLMEEKQLLNFKFFRRLGAFSIIRDKPFEIKKSLRYILKLLTNGSNKTLLIFPQGQIFPNDRRPLQFFEGLTYLCETIPKCGLIPCSIRIEFLGEFKPEIFVHFGDILYFEKTKKKNRKLLTKKLENILTENLDSLKSDIIENKFENYKKVF